MEAWQEEYFHMSSQGVSEEELFSSLVTQAAHFGFEYCSYTMRAPVSLISQDTPEFIFLNNYPEAWKTLYQEQKLFEVDPIIKQAQRAFMPFLWSKELLKQSQEFKRAARLHGFRFGWVHPFHSKTRAMGIFALVRSERPVTQEELGRKQRDMAWMARLANQSMMDCILPRLMPEIKESLTAHELEVLRWTAEGRTSAEIGDILSTSKRNVDFHIANFTEKLGVKNKTAAAVRAFTLGLIR